ncbi:MAG TPA: DMT family transporter [Aestuariivirga sp.]|jgi:drug/metabolite transporter (DMT)-like permease|nr:DMT family transporter [Aestuariivirga sp.]
MPPSQTPHSNTLAGIALMLGAMFVLPFLDVVAKFLGQQNVPIIEIVWARLFFGMVMTAPLVWKFEGARSLIPQRPVIHTIRATFLVAATGLFFWALKFQGIAETLAIFFVQPLVITMLSPFVLGEKVGVRRWLAVAVGFMGTLIIIRPGFQSLNPGVFMALGAGTSLALYMLLTRRIAGSAGAMTTTFLTSLAGSVITSIAVVFVWQAPTLQQWQQFLLLAFIATFGHYLIVRAYDYAEASLLAPLGYTEMIMAVIAGWYFFGDFPDIWTFVGVGVLIACAIYISYRERVRNVPPLETPPTMIS